MANGQVYLTSSQNFYFVMEPSHIPSSTVAKMRGGQECEVSSAGGRVKIAGCADPLGSLVLPGAEFKSGRFWLACAVRDGGVSAIPAACHDAHKDARVAVG